MGIASLLDPASSGHLKKCSVSVLPCWLQRLPLGQQLWSKKKKKMTSWTVFCKNGVLIPPMELHDTSWHFICGLGNTRFLVNNRAMITTADTHSTSLSTSIYREIQCHLCLFFLFLSFLFFGLESAGFTKLTTSREHAVNRWRRILYSANALKLLRRLMGKSLCWVCASMTTPLCENK